MHLTLLPYIKASGELKTKPTQHSVKELRSIGLAPDILVCRSEGPIPQKEREKLALFCNVRPDSVIAAQDLSSIYDAPLAYHREGLDQAVLDAFQITPAPRPNLAKWEDVSERIHNPEGEVNVAIVGKYTKTHDTYLSIHRALEHAAFAQDRPVHITYVSCEEANVCDTLSRYHGVVIPGGFGGRGLEGIIACAQTCRNQNIPLLGICLGMQMMCIAAIRNQYDNQCTSCESIDSDGVPVEFHSVVPIASLNHSILGGTMKLGKHATYVRNPSTRTYQLYGAPANQMVFERHRHRYEINPKHVTYLQQDGITVSGYSTEDCVDIVEDVSKRFYIGCQFHPEYQSQLQSQSPLFTEFIKQSSV